MPGRSAMQPRRFLVVVAAFTHLLLLFIVPVTTAAQLKQSDDGSLLRLTEGRSRGCNINCSDKPRPVCGSDDRTYNSRCELDKYNQCNKDSPPVVVKHRGKCSVEETQCRIDRTQALKNRRQKQTLEFVPECKDDGSFAEVQCHQQSGYCWCVTEKGKPVPKSSMKNERPNCSNQGRATSRRSSRGRKERKDEQVDPGSKAKTPHPEQEVRDGPLLGGRNLGSQDATLRPADTTFKPTEDDLTDCLRERQNTLEENSHSENKFFVPECTSDGKYNKIQCYKAPGYCWCVEQETGKMIQGTTVMNSHPNCDKQPRMKNIKGCPDQKKRRFILELLDVLHKDMMAANSSLGANQHSPDPDVKRYEKAALWKFNKLDSNNNKGIDRKEWKDFKNDVKKRKGLLRKCGRNFLKYCDDNNDKKVSSEEWIACLNLNKGQLLPSGKPNGHNPIHILNPN